MGVKKLGIQQIKQKTTNGEKITPINSSKACNVFVLLRRYRIDIPDKININSSAKDNLEYFSKFCVMI